MVPRHKDWVSCSLTATVNKRCSSWVYVEDVKTTIVVKSGPVFRLAELPHPLMESSESVSYIWQAPPRSNRSLRRLQIAPSEVLNNSRGFR